MDYIEEWSDHRTKFEVRSDQGECWSHKSRTNFWVASESHEIFWSHDSQIRGLLGRTMVAQVLGSHYV